MDAVCKQFCSYLSENSVPIVQISRLQSYREIMAFNCVSRIRYIYIYIYIYKIRYVGWMEILLMLQQMVYSSQSTLIVESNVTCR